MSPEETTSRMVTAERVAQIEQGYDPTNDDANSMHDWATFIGRRIYVATEAAVQGDTAEVLKRMVQVAAMAEAAVESIVRKRPPLPLDMGDRSELKRYRGTGYETGRLGG